jgi:hypothetical protein
MFGSRQCKIFLFSTASRPTLGPRQPHIQWVPGAVSPGVKRLGREADHSPPSSAEVKNGGAIPPLSHMSSWYSAYLLHQMKLEMKNTHNPSYTIRTKGHCNNRAHKRISQVQYHNSQQNVHNSRWQELLLRVQDRSKNAPDMWTGYYNGKYQSTLQYTTIQAAHNIYHTHKATNTRINKKLSVANPRRIYK